MQAVQDCDGDFPPGYSGLSNIETIIGNGIFSASHGGGISIPSWQQNATEVPVQAFQGTNNPNFPGQWGIGFIPTRIPPCDPGSNTINAFYWIQTTHGTYAQVFPLIRSQWDCSISQVPPHAHQQHAVGPQQYTLTIDPNTNLATIEHTGLVRNTCYDTPETRTSTYILDFAANATGDVELIEPSSEFSHNYNNTSHTTITLSNISTHEGSCSNPCFSNQDPPNCPECMTVVGHPEPPPGYGGDAGVNGLYEPVSPADYPEGFGTDFGRGVWKRLTSEGEYYLRYTTTYLAPENRTNWAIWKYTGPPPIPGLPYGRTVRMYFMRTPDAHRPDCPSGNLAPGLWEAHSQHGENDPIFVTGGACPSPEPSYGPCDGCYPPGAGPPRTSPAPCIEIISTTPSPSCGCVDGVYTLSGINHPLSLPDGSYSDGSQGYRYGYKKTCPDGTETHINYGYSLEHGVTVNEWRLYNGPPGGGVVPLPPCNISSLDDSTSDNTAYPQNLNWTGYTITEVPCSLPSPEPSPSPGPCTDGGNFVCVSGIPLFTHLFGGSCTSHNREVDLNGDYEYFEDINGRPAFRKLLFNLDSSYGGGTTTPIYAVIYYHKTGTLPTDAQAWMIVIRPVSYNYCTMPPESEQIILIYKAFLDELGNEEPFRLQPQYPHCTSDCFRETSDGLGNEVGCWEPLNPSELYPQPPGSVNIEPGQCSPSPGVPVPEPSPSPVAPEPSPSPEVSPQPSPEPEPDPPAASPSPSPSPTCETICVKGLRYKEQVKEWALSGKYEVNGEYELLPLTEDALEGNEFEKYGKSIKERQAQKVPDFAQYGTTYKYWRPQDPIYKKTGSVQVPIYDEFGNQLTFDDGSLQYYIEYFDCYIFTTSTSEAEDYAEKKTVYGVRFFTKGESLVKPQHASKNSMKAFMRASKLKMSKDDCEAWRECYADICISLTGATDGWEPFGQWYDNSFIFGQTTLTIEKGACPVEVSPSPIPPSEAEEPYNPCITLCPPFDNDPLAFYAGVYEPMLFELGEFTDGYPAYIANEYKQFTFPHGKSPNGEAYIVAEAKDVRQEPLLPPESNSYWIGTANNVGANDILLTRNSFSNDRTNNTSYMCDLFSGLDIDPGDSYKVGVGPLAEWTITASHDCTARCPSPSPTTVIPPITPSPSPLTYNGLCITFDVKRLGQALGCATLPHPEGLIKRGLLSNFETLSFQGEWSVIAQTVCTPEPHANLGFILNTDNGAILIPSDFNTPGSDPQIKSNIVYRVNIKVDISSTDERGIYLTVWKLGEDGNIIEPHIYSAKQGLPENFNPIFQDSTNREFPTSVGFADEWYQVGIGGEQWCLDNIGIHNSYPAGGFMNLVCEEGEGSEHPTQPTGFTNASWGNACEQNLCVYGLNDTAPLDVNNPRASRHLNGEYERFGTDVWRKSLSGSLYAAIQRNNNQVWVLVITDGNPLTPDEEIVASGANSYHPSFSIDSSSGESSVVEWTIQSTQNYHSCPSCGSERIYVYNTPPPGCIETPGVSQPPPSAEPPPVAIPTGQFICANSIVGADSPDYNGTYELISNKNLSISHFDTDIWVKSNTHDEIWITRNAERDGKWSLIKVKGEDYYRAAELKIAFSGDNPVDIPLGHWKKYNYYGSRSEDNIEVVGLNFHHGVCPSVPPGPPPEEICVYGVKGYASRINGKYKLTDKFSYGKPVYSQDDSGESPYLLKWTKIEGRFGWHFAYFHKADFDHNSKWYYPFLSTESVSHPDLATTWIMNTSPTLTFPAGKSVGGLPKVELCGEADKIEDICVKNITYKQNKTGKPKLNVNGTYSKVGDGDTWTKDSSAIDFTNQVSGWTATASFTKKDDKWLLSVLQTNAAGAQETVSVMKNVGSSTETKLPPCYSTNWREQRGWVFEDGEIVICNVCDSEPSPPPPSPSLPPEPPAPTEPECPCDLISRKGLCVRAKIRREVASNTYRVETLLPDGTKKVQTITACEDRSRRFGKCRWKKWFGRGSGGSAAWVVEGRFLCDADDNPCSDSNILKFSVSLPSETDHADQTVYLNSSQFKADTWYDLKCSVLYLNTYLFDTNTGQSVPDKAYVRMAIKEEEKSDSADNWTANQITVDLLGGATATPEIDHICEYQQNTADAGSKITFNSNSFFFGFEGEIWPIKDVQSSKIEPNTENFNGDWHDDCVEPCYVSAPFVDPSGSPSASPVTVPLPIQPNPSPGSVIPDVASVCVSGLGPIQGDNEFSGLAVSGTYSYAGLRNGYPYYQNHLSSDIQLTIERRDESGVQDGLPAAATWVLRAFTDNYTVLVYITYSQQTSPDLVSNVDWIKQINDNIVSGTIDIVEGACFVSPSPSPPPDIYLCEHRDPPRQIGEGEPGEFNDSNVYEIDGKKYVDGELTQANGKYEYSGTDENGKAIYIGPDSKIGEAEQAIVGQWKIIVKRHASGSSPTIYRWTLVFVNSRTQAEAIGAWSQTRYDSRREDVNLPNEEEWTAFIPYGGDPDSSVDSVGLCSPFTSSFACRVYVGTTPCDTKFWLPSPGPSVSPPPSAVPSASPEPSITPSVSPPPPIPECQTGFPCICVSGLLRYGVLSEANGVYFHAGCTKQKDKFGVTQYMPYYLKDPSRIGSSSDTFGGATYIRFIHTDGSDEGFWNIEINRETAASSTTQRDSLWQTEDVPVATPDRVQSAPGFIGGPFKWNPHALSDYSGDVNVTQCSCPPVPSPDPGYDGHPICVSGILPDTVGSDANGQYTSEDTHNGRPYYRNEKGSEIYWDAEDEVWRIYGNSGAEPIGFSQGDTDYPHETVQWNLETNYSGIELSVTQGICPEIIPPGSILISNICVYGYKFNDIIGGKYDLNGDYKYVGLKNGKPMYEKTFEYGGFEHTLVVFYTTKWNVALRENGVFTSYFIEETSEFFDYPTEVKNWIRTAEGEAEGYSSVLNVSSGCPSPSPEPLCPSIVCIDGINLDNNTRLIPAINGIYNKRGIQNGKCKYRKAKNEAGQYIYLDYRRRENSEDFSWFIWYYENSDAARNQEKTYLYVDMYGAPPGPGREEIKGNFESPTQIPPTSWFALKNKVESDSSTNKYLPIIYVCDEENADLESFCVRGIIKDGIYSSANQKYTWKGNIENGKPRYLSKDLNYKISWSDDEEDGDWSISFLEEGTPMWQLIATSDAKKDRPLDTVTSDWSFSEALQLSGAVEVITCEDESVCVSGLIYSGKTDTIVNGTYHLDPDSTEGPIYRKCPVGGASSGSSLCKFSISVDKDTWVLEFLDADLDLHKIYIQSDNASGKPHECGPWTIVDEKTSTLSGTPSVTFGTCPTPSLSPSAPPPPAGGCPKVVPQKTICAENIDELWAVNAEGDVVKKYDVTGIYEYAGISGDIYPGLCDDCVKEAPYYKKELEPGVFSFISVELGCNHQWEIWGNYKGETYRGIHTSNLSDTFVNSPELADWHSSITISAGECTSVICVLGINIVKEGGINTSHASATNGVYQLSGTFNGKKRYKLNDYEIYWNSKKNSWYLFGNDAIHGGSSDSQGYVILKSEGNEVNSPELVSSWSFVSSKNHGNVTMQKFSPPGDNICGPINPSPALPSSIPASPEPEPPFTIIELPIDPSIAPLPSVTPTPSASPACGVIESSRGQPSFPRTDIYTIQENGTIQFQYSSLNWPNKFVVSAKGTEIYNTGYIGFESFQGELSAALGTRGLPQETIGGPASGSFKFLKTQAMGEEIKVEIYSPISNSEYSYVLECATSPPPGYDDIIYPPTSPEPVDKICVSGFDSMISNLNRQSVFVPKLLSGDGTYIRTDYGGKIRYEKEIDDNSGVMGQPSAFFVESENSKGDKQWKFFVKGSEQTPQMFNGFYPVATSMDLKQNAVFEYSPAEGKDVIWSFRDWCQTSDNVLTLPGIPDTPVSVFCHLFYVNKYACPITSPEPSPSIVPYEDNFIYFCVTGIRYPESFGNPNGNYVYAGTENGRYKASNESFEIYWNDQDSKWNIRRKIDGYVFAETKRTDSTPAGSSRWVFTETSDGYESDFSQDSEIWPPVEHEEEFLNSEIGVVSDDRLRPESAYSANIECVAPVCVTGIKEYIVNSSVGLDVGDSLDVWKSRAFDSHANGEYTWHGYTYNEKPVYIREAVVGYEYVPATLPVDPLEPESSDTNVYRRKYYMFWSNNHWEITHTFEPRNRQDALFSRFFNATGNDVDADVHRSLDFFWRKVACSTGGSFGRDTYLPHEAEDWNCPYPDSLLFIKYYHLLHEFYWKQKESSNASIIDKEFNVPLYFSQNMRVDKCSINPVQPDPSPPNLNPSPATSEDICVYRVIETNGLECQPWEGNGVYKVSGKHNDKNLYVKGSYKIIWESSGFPQEVKHWQIFDSSNNLVAISSGWDYDTSTPSDMSEKCPPEISEDTPHWVNGEGKCETIYVYEAFEGY